MQDSSLTVVESKGVHAKNCKTSSQRGVHGVGIQLSQTCRLRTGPLIRDRDPGWAGSLLHTRASPSLNLLDLEYLRVR